MSNIPAPTNNSEFAEHWMVWLVLRHFLPARLLRELAETVLKHTSGLTIGDLFEEILHGSSVWDESWTVQPREVTEQGDHARERWYYIHLVRSLAWQNDEGGWAPMLEKTEDDGRPDPALIDDIVRFGSADFGWDAEHIDRRFEPRLAALQASVRVLLQVFKTAKNAHQALTTGDFWRDIGSLIDPMCMPLRAVMTKHVADWCADADEWEKALAGYDRARELLVEWEPGAGWEGAASAWESCIIGSRGAAFAITQDDPSGTARMLDDALRETSLRDDPLRTLNLSFDALRASFHAKAEGFKAQDRKIATAAAPLLHSSHDPYTAMSYSLRGKYDDATRRFWGLLRRQLALGAAADSRTTKTWYARSLIDELSAVLQENVRPESFGLAARMLIESGNDGAVERISWTAALLARYVDEACVKMVIDRAARHKGSRIERELVVIALFKAWGPELRGPAHRDAVLLMWRHVAALAQEFKAEFSHELDVGRASLKALRDLAEKRPELRSEVAGDVQRAICEQLRSTDGFWMGWGEACETASEYADAFDAGSMELVIHAVVERLRNIDAATDLSPVTRRALAFLVRESVTRYARDLPATGKAILEQILRIGIEQESEHRTLLYYLHDFDASLLDDKDLRAKLEEAGIIEHLLEQASNIRSSGVTDAIKALLFAPAVSGRKGIECALDSLKRILASADGERESLGLARAYDAILLLLQFRQKIEAVLSGNEEWLRMEYRELLSGVAAVWRQAAHRPLIFASFAIPLPTKPNPVVVHNWAFASLRFAEALGQTELIDAALREASENTELRPHIALARATRAVANPIDADALEEARTENPEVFYTTIGRRLAQLKASAEPAELCKILIEQCLRFGPKDIDAAVFLEAVRLDLREHVRASGLRDYEKRVEQDRDRRLVLGPILDLFGNEAVRS